MDEGLREELAATFRQLGDPNRLAIVLACRDEERSVGALASELGLSVSLVSQHLRRLRDARLVQARRDGKQVLCRLADGHVRRMLDDMVEHVAHPESCDAAAETPHPEEQP
ncbi:MAG: transcriptional regulator [Geminicoccaceae bacterium]|nr:MAG: transcriptional regulator [Geminicoccaceae bacterium]